MNKNLWLTVTLLASCALGASWYFSTSPAASGYPTVISGQVDGEEPQCGHWAVLRSSQLLGVPITMPGVLAVLPASKKGHSLLQLAEVLNGLGIDAQGVHLGEKDLSNTDSPFIAHLEEPDHFVVVTGVDGQTVRLFDGSGKMSHRDHKQFLKQWSGKVLVTEKGPGGPLIPELPSGPAPRLQFETLYVDVGDVPLSSTTIPFVFPVHNAGNAPLEIQDIETSCSCTEANVEKRRLLPGESGVIRFDYNIKADPAHIRSMKQVQKGPGVFQYIAHVKSNDPVFPVVKLILSGSCDISVQALPPVLNVGQLILGQETRDSIVVRYTGRSEGFEVIDATVDVDGLDVSHRVFETEYRMGKITSPFDEQQGIELTLTGTTLGRFKGMVRIKTSIAGFEELELPLVGRVVQPVLASPSALIFARHSKEKQSQTVRLDVGDGDSFRVVRIEHPSIKGACTNKDPGFSTQIEFEINMTDSATAGEDIRVFVEFEEAEPISIAIPVAFN